MLEDKGVRDDIFLKANIISEKKIKRKKWGRIILIMSCYVASGTIYMLKLPAITMETEKSMICSEASLSDHTHSNACENEQGDIACGYSDFVIHTHDAECFDANGDLICCLPEILEHQHSESCFTKTLELICNLSEDISHQHDAECYDQSGEQVCLLSETEGHLHSDSCYLEKMEMICEQPEISYHCHGPECFDDAENWVCGENQVLRHQHTKTCFKTTEEIEAGNDIEQMNGHEENTEVQDSKQNEETQISKQDEAIQQEKKENDDITEVRNMICEGNDYIVSVSFTSEAELPDDVVLMVREILPESTEYATYYEQTKLMMPEDQGLVFCRFFDVSFEVDEVEVEPKSTVDVQISYNKPIAQDENTTCSVVHFAEDETELLSAEIQTNENGGDTISFSQDSFSVVGTAITALNLSEGSYIFYKDEYAIGANFYGLKEIEIAIDENGYVRPKSSDANIDMITWTYKNGALQNKSTGQYLNLEQNNATVSDWAQTIDARIINNAVRFSKTVSTGWYGTVTYYLGFSIDESYTSKKMFADGDYFLAAKVETVDDIVIEPGALEISDQIKQSGCIYPQLNIENQQAANCKYVWYRSSDNGNTWEQVVRRKITGEYYNVAEDGSWLNVALDKGADKTYKVVLTEIYEMQLTNPIESRIYHIPYFDNVQNGDFERPVISTDVSDAEHYQPFLPNGTAGMVWKTTADDGEIEYVSVASSAFRNMSYNWHNCEAAASGLQYVELNANMDGALYQDILTVPDSTMYWSLAHRGRGPSDMRNNRNATDTMYVVMMSTVMAEQYDITSQAKVQDVISNQWAYPGAKVVPITDDNIRWYYHSGSYVIPSQQYLTRFFFVAGETAFDRYSPGSGLAHTIGNHLDDIYFSTELPPPAEGKANLTIEKKIVGLDEQNARALLNQIAFAIDGDLVQGSQFANFEALNETSFVASYQMQIDLGIEEYTTKVVEEVLATAEVNGYSLVGTSVGVNDNGQAIGNSTSIRIRTQETGKVTFVNEYIPRTVTIEIQKVDESNQPLAGAMFSLLTFNDGQWTVVSDTIQVDNEGKVQVPDLRYDTLYQLKETCAPDGYLPLEESIYFMVKKTDDEITLLPCDMNGQVIDSWPLKVTSLSGNFVGLQIANQQGVILPETGGIGTSLFMMVGFYLIISAFIFGFSVRRIRGRRLE